MENGLLDARHSANGTSKVLRSHSYCEDPVNFDPDSYEYRIWCGVRVASAFVIISVAQFVLAMGLLSAGIIALFPLADTNHTSTNNGTPKISAKDEYEGVFAFERWPALVYFRLVVAVLLVMGLVFAVISLVTLRPRLLFVHIAVNCVAVVSAIAYVALLTWHCAVQRDYFAFCFVGLTLFLILLVNVLAAHCAIELQTYLVALTAFMAYAAAKWPDVVRNHQKKADVGSRYLSKLMLSRSLVSRARADRVRQASTNRRPPLSSRQQSHCSSQLITSVIHESPDE